MKPGSADRCKSKAPDGRLRCHLRTDHDGGHQAPRRDRTVYWYTTPDGLVL